jgi:hypothetical protein
VKNSRLAPLAHRLRVRIETLLHGAMRRFGYSRATAVERLWLHGGI